MDLLSTVWHHSHRYWSVHAVPLGKVISHLSPPTSPPPQSHRSVSGIHCALGLTRIPTGFVSDYLSVLLKPVCDWCMRSLVHMKTHVHRHNLSHTHCLSHTQRHVTTYSIMGNFPLKITVIMACLKILINKSLRRLFICFIHNSLVWRNIRSLWERRHFIKRSFNPLPY